MPGKEAAIIQATVDEHSVNDYITIKIVHLNGKEYRQIGFLKEDDPGGELTWCYHPVKMEDLRALKLKLEEVIGDCNEA